MNSGLRKNFPSNWYTQWTKNGFLHIKGFFPETQLLDKWTKELFDWPETAGKWMKYFENSTISEQKRMLCRVENFLEYHAGWQSVIQNPELLAILESLLGEEPVLFKEKINFKLPGGNGFTAHQDAPAFFAFGQDFHITAMVSIDATTVENGCLEMVYGRHNEGLLHMTEDKVLSPEAIESMEWVPLETQPGDLVLFGSYIPHRSGPNRSSSSRRAAYITYNAASLGSRRDEYYANKREVFPPEIERIPGKDYSNSGMYNIGNPIEK